MHYIQRLTDVMKIAKLIIAKLIVHCNDENLYGSVYVHRVVALVGIISTLCLSICLVDLPHLDKLMSRCRVKMTQIDILSF